MKAVVAAFNQEKALVGAFSVITNLRMELFGALSTTVTAQRRPLIFHLHLGYLEEEWKYCLSARCSLPIASQGRKCSLLKEMKFQPEYNLCATNIEWPRCSVESVARKISFSCVLVNGNDKSA